MLRANRFARIALRIARATKYTTGVETLTWSTFECKNGRFASCFSPLRHTSASDFQSEVGEVSGEIGGELPAKFRRRFSSFFCWGESSEAFSAKTPPQISPSNFTTRFWVVAGPRRMAFRQENCLKNGQIYTLKVPLDRVSFDTPNTQLEFLSGSRWFAGVEF